MKPQQPTWPKEVCNRTRAAGRQHIISVVIRCSQRHGQKRLSNKSSIQRSGDCPLAITHRMWPPCRLRPVVAWPHRQLNCSPTTLPLHEERQHNQCRTTSDDEPIYILYSRLHTLQRNSLYCRRQRFQQQGVCARYRIYHVLSWRIRKQRKQSVGSEVDEQRVRSHKTHGYAAHLRRADERSSIWDVI